MTLPETTKLESALEGFRRDSDVPGQLQTLKRLGEFYQERRQYAKAVPYLRQALECSREQGTPADRVVALAGLGCVYWEMAQLKKAVAHFEEALKTAREIGDEESRSILLIMIGISYWRKCEWDAAMTCFRQALQDRCELNNERYTGLLAAIERGVATLKNRIRMAQEENNLMRLLQPKFSILPLLFFTGRKQEIPALLEEISPLAERVGKQDIIETIPKFKQFLDGAMD